MKPYYRIACLLLSLLLFFSTAACTNNTSPTTATEATTTVTTTVPTTILTTVTTTTTTTVTTITTTTAATKVNAAPSPTKPAAVLDPAYERLLLVNATHTLTKDYDSQVELVEIPKKYINGSLRQIDKHIYPYVEAMIEAAKRDGVTLYVRSPFRSYNTQTTLFNNKVNNVIKAGTPKENAEAVAARSVARPGTSEHQTGLAIDFNTASSKFENTPAHKWMVKNAENYGFILRYPKDKTDITGIIYEPWHWRFVGINTAKEINRLGLTLEEYVDRRNEESPL